MVRRFILRLYTSLYKRVHTWGVFLLLSMLYLTTFALKFPAVTKLFSRAGLMSVHVFCGFTLILVFILIAYHYLLGVTFGTDLDSEAQGTYRIITYRLISMGSRWVINILYYSFLFLVCLLGMAYYVIKTYALDTVYFSLNLAFLSHAIVGWFFLSIFFVKYYLTITQWIEEMFHYLREY